MANYESWYIGSVHPWDDFSLSLKYSFSVLKKILKAYLHDQSFPSKTWSKNFDGLWRNRNPSYFPENFETLMGIDQSKHVFGIKI